MDADFGWLRHIPTLCNLASIRVVVVVVVTASVSLEVLYPVHCRLSSYAPAIVAAIIGNNKVKLVL